MSSSSSFRPHDLSHMLSHMLNNFTHTLINYEHRHLPVPDCPRGWTLETILNRAEIMVDWKKMTVLLSSPFETSREIKRDFVPEGNCTFSVGEIELPVAWDLPARYEVPIKARRFRTEWDEHQTDSGLYLLYRSIRAPYSVLKHSVSMLEALLMKSVSNFFLVQRGSVHKGVALKDGADLDIDIIIPRSWCKKEQMDEMLVKEGDNIIGIEGLKKFLRRLQERLVNDSESDTLDTANLETDDAEMLVFEGEEGDSSLSLTGNLDIQGDAVLPGPVVFKKFENSRGACLSQPSYTASLWK